MKVILSKKAIVFLILHRSELSVSSGSEIGEFLFQAASDISLQNNMLMLSEDQTEEEDDDAEEITESPQVVPTQIQPAATTIVSSKQKMIETMQSPMQTIHVHTHHIVASDQVVRIIHCFLRYLEGKNNCSPNPRVSFDEI